MAARHLSDRERAVLALIVASSVRELAGQLASVRVLGGPPTFLDLGVEDAVQAVEVPDGPLPARAIIYATNGAPEGEVLVWVRAGYLCALEHAWYTDEAPAQFPSIETVRIEGVAP